MVRRERRHLMPHATLALMLVLLPWGAAAQTPAAPVRVVLETEHGEIELELDAVRAPVTVANFLKYVDAGRYDGGIFHRTVRPGNQKTQAVPIAVVQAQSNARGPEDLFPAIPLERTNATGLPHLDGTVSMARTTPDTATSHFFVCIGDQPELDFGGRRNPDGQGFAAFGRVVSGMDVVRTIHMAGAEGERLSPPIGITRARRR
jgi:peptidyl-prolyl cis-trans isomerase A (cyclophilin A)